MPRRGANGMGETGWGSHTKRDSGECSGWGISHPLPPVGNTAHSGKDQKKGQG